MVIEEILRKKSTKNMRSRFKSSIDYASELKGQTTAQQRLAQTFGNNIDYGLNDKPDQELRGERVVHTFHSNNVTSIKNAALEMETVSRFARCEDPSVHTVFSYDANMNEFSDKDLTSDEKRAEVFEKIQQDVERWMRNRGLVDAPYADRKSTEKRDSYNNAPLNQYVAVIHGDTDNLHVHVIANRVSMSGFVTSNFHNFAINHHTATDISIDRNWPIVIGHYNMKKALEQARSWGATKEEIKQLETGNYKNLLSLRQEKERTLHLTAVEKAARNDGKVSFVNDYSDTIQRAFKNSSSMREFQQKCEAAGVIVKYTEKGDKRVPNLAFSDLYDKDGNSGSKIGVPAKDLVAKFGKSEKYWFDRPAPIDLETAAKQSLDAKQEQLKQQSQAKPKTVYVASETRNESELKKLVSLNKKEADEARAQIAAIRSTRRHKLIMTASQMGFFTKSADARRQRIERLERVAKAKVYANDNINKTLIKLEGERLKLVKQLNATDEKYKDKRENLTLRIQAINVKAEYELYKSQFSNNRKIERQQVYAEAEKALKRAKPSMFAKFAINTRAEIQTMRKSYYPSYIRKLKRESLNRLYATAKQRKSEIYEWRKQTVAAIDAQKPATYEAWLKQQKQTPQIQTAIAAEIAKQKWIDEQNAQRLKAKAPTPPKRDTAEMIIKTAEQIKADQAAKAQAEQLAKAQAAETARLKAEQQAKIDAEHRAKLAEQKAAAEAARLKAEQQAKIDAEQKQKEKEQQAKKEQTIVKPTSQSRGGGRGR